MAAATTRGTEKPRGILIAGNWKMNHTVAETEAFFAALSSAQLDPATRAGLIELARGANPLALRWGK